MKKTLIFIFAAIILLSFPAFAKTADFENVFSLSDTYHSITFDDNSELSAFSGSFELQNGVFGADSGVLSVFDAKFLLPKDILYAKNSVKFDIFIPDETSSAEINVNMQNKNAVLSLAQKDGEVSAALGRQKIAQILSGKWYTVGISADLNEKNLYIGIDGVCVKSFSIGSGDIVNSVSIFSEQKIYIDNFTVSQNVFAASKNPVLYKNGAYVVAECEKDFADSGKMLVLAEYNKDGSVTNVSAKKTDGGGVCVRTAAGYNSLHEYRAFLWDEKIVPEAEMFIKSDGGAFLSDFTFLKNYTVNQTENEYKITPGKPLQNLVSGYLYEVKKDGETIINKKAERTDAENNGIAVDLTALSSGEYEIRVFLEYNSKYKTDFAKEKFYVFKEGGDYAFSVGSKDFLTENKKEELYGGLIPVYENGALYLPDCVLQKNFGIDVKNADGGLYLAVNGKKFPLSDEEYISSDTSYFVSLSFLANALGYEYHSDANGVFVMSKNGFANDKTAKEYKKAFTDYIISDSFDSSNLTWQKIPVGWSFYDWGANSSIGGDYFLADFGNDGKSICIGAVEKSYAGIQSDAVFLDKNNTGYTAEADIYAEDYEGNSVGIALMTRKGGTFLKMLTAPVSGTLKNGEWVRISADFSKSAIDETGADSFRVLVYTKKDGTANAASGRIYADNVTLSFTDRISEAYDINIYANNEFSWYTLGESVVYTADFLPPGVDKIEAVIYDTESIVFKKTISAYTFLNSGLKYTPEKEGYYEAEFYAVRSDGKKIPVAGFYNKYYEDKIGGFEILRRSFAVVKGEAKSVSERNKKLFVSSHALSEGKDLQIGNMIGFYGARIHWIRWGDSATVKGAHTAKGKFDWTNIDKQFENVKKFGYGKIAANIYGTPRWAVKEENRNKTDYTIAGSMRYNNFAPEKQEYLEEFLTEFVKRYKGDTDIIEFWNEPQSGSTAFWADGTENFAQMMKTAYNAIKSADGSITVSIGGMGNNRLYYTFYDELLDDADIYNYYDVIAFHGTYNVNTKLNNEIAPSHNLEPKKWWNSEGYFANYSQNGVLTDKFDGAKAFAVSFLQNFKAGADIITAFSLLDIVGDEYRVFVNENGGKTASYGMFRSYPYIEPKLSAVAAFNMFELMEDNFEYLGEQRFDGVRTVSFKNGESTLVAFWSSGDEKFKIPDRLSFLNGCEICDFEGKIHTGSYFNPDKIYFAKNVPEESLAGILDSDSNNVLNPDMAAPYYNAQ